MSQEIGRMGFDRKQALERIFSRLRVNVGKAFLSLFIKSQAVQSFVNAHLYPTNTAAESLLAVSFFNESIDAKFHNKWYLRVSTPLLDTDFFRHSLMA